MGDQGVVIYADYTRTYTNLHEHVSLWKEGGSVRYAGIFRVANPRAVPFSATCMRRDGRIAALIAGGFPKSQ